MKILVPLRTTLSAVAAETARDCHSGIMVGISLHRRMEGGRLR
jgi:hypothetical protein